MFVSLRLPVVALAAGVLAAALSVPPWTAVMATGGVLAVLVAADVWRAPRAGELRISREAPEVTGLGETTPIALRLHNPGSRRMEIGVRDASPPSLARTPPRHAVGVPPGAWVRLEAEARPWKRGYATLGPVTVRTSGPFGLAGRQAAVQLEGRMKVYPALPGRAEAKLRLERALTLQSGERSAAFRGGGSEFDSLREYHPDDEFRRINWRATARAGEPITNLYREDRNQQVLLLLDAGRMMAGNLGGLPRFEYAIDAAFAVAELAARIGDHVGMVAFGSRVLAMTAPRSGRHQPRAILDLLFDLEPALEAPDYRGAFSAVLAGHGRRSLLVLLTELTEERAMESLFESLPPLLARHLLLLGSVRDPELERRARITPAGSGEAYEKAAAAELLDERDRSALRLRSMGVSVQDRPPGELAGALVDHYLRVKSAGRL